MNIKELLESPEGKAAIQAAVEESTKGLKTKNDELLAKLTKEKDERKAAQDALDAEKAAKEEAEAAAAEKSGDVEKVKQALETKHRKELETRDTALNTAKGQLNKLLIDNGLTEALTKAGVAPQYLAAAKALIQANNKADIADVDGNPVAQIDGVSVSDFVSTWSQGDNGKHFVAAPNNGGGGANGANSGGKAGAAKADLGGDKAARVAALQERFPELPKT